MKNVPIPHPKNDANKQYAISSFVFSSNSCACENNVHMKIQENDMKR